MAKDRMTEILTCIFSYRGGRGRGEGGSGGYRGQSPRGNGTKFFYQRGKFYLACWKISIMSLFTPSFTGRGNYHSQGDNNSQNDRWEREAPQNIQGPQGKNYLSVVNYIYSLIL